MSHLVKAVEMINRLTDVIQDQQNEIQRLNSRVYNAELAIMAMNALLQEHLPELAPSLENVFVDFHRCGVSLDPDFASSINMRHNLK